MSKMTVKDLAKIAGTTVDKLLEQFKQAGISIDNEDSEVNAKDKQTLLKHLRDNRTTSTAESMSVAKAPSKITLKRKSTSQLTVASGKTKGNVVNVEVRKKKTYVHRSLKELKEQEEKEALEKARLKEEQKRIEEEERLAAEAAELEAQKQAEAEQKAAEEEKALADAKGKPKEDAPEDQQLSKATVTGESLEEPVEASEEIDDDDDDEAEDFSEKKKKSNKKSKSKGRDDDESKNINLGVNVGLYAIDDVFDSSSEEELVEVIEEDAKQSKIQTKATSTSSVKLRGAAAKLTKHKFAVPTKPIVKQVEIPEEITVGELAQKMSIKVNVLIKALMKSGIMATVNQNIEQDEASLMVEEFGHKPVLVSLNQIEIDLVNSIQDNVSQESRPPVVTIMGHVDHGKTSLLDKIRSSQVTDSEAGGITQHIGAYQVTTDEGAITFIDTPGHAAFTAMRARGSQCTDIVILVVAADDGVMPQTEEAIQHAKAAGVPIIVAVNKIDKPEVDLERVKGELAAKEVVPEDWGGENIFVNVSAMTGEGIDELLSSILLQAEVLELKASKQGSAKGVIVESRLDKGRGVVATVLVQHGTLRKGDVVVAGLQFGKVRALLDENTKVIKQAVPSTPTEILGFSGMPSAGDELFVVKNERKARDLIEHRQAKIKEDEQARAMDANALFSQMAEQSLKKVNVLLKADVHGSVEALKDSLEKLSQKDVKVSVIYKGVGGISESDINLAKASNAIVIGFNVRADGGAKQLADDEEITIYYYSIIYEVIDEIKKLVIENITPTIKETIIGIAEVKDVFRSSKLADIAGCMVIEGTVKKSNPIRVLRDNVVIYEGQLESLRRFKDDVNEVKMGTECGIGVKDYNDVKSGDLIEVFERTEVVEVDDDY